MFEMLIGKNLEKALNGRVTIAPANNTVVGKIGDNYGNIKQLTMSTMNEGKTWNVGDGPAISIFDDDFKLDFKAALDKLASEIVNYAKGDSVKFHLLVMPLRAVERSNMEGCGDILIRYLEGYLPATDAIAYRYDILISKEN